MSEWVNERIHLKFNLDILINGCGWLLIWFLLIWNYVTKKPKIDHIKCKIATNCKCLWINATERKPEWERNRRKWEKNARSQSIVNGIVSACGVIILNRLNFKFDRNWNFDRGSTNNNEMMMIILKTFFGRNDFSGFVILILFPCFVFLSFLQIFHLYTNNSFYF